MLTLDEADTPLGRFETVAAWLPSAIPVVVTAYVTEPTPPAASTPVCAPTDTTFLLGEPDGLPHAVNAMITISAVNTLNPKSLLRFFILIPFIPGNFRGFLDFVAFFYRNTFSQKIGCFFQTIVSLLYTFT